jgi:hypothetical protein
VCRQELSRTKSATSKVINAILDAIFDFFERLFSPRGRGLRRFVYICLSAYVGYLLIRRLWKGPGHRSWSNAAPLRAWVKQGDHRWLVAGCAGVAALLVIYAARRQRQVKRGIKSPPWLLIAVVAFGALGVSLAAGFLLYKFAPDRHAKFDAVKTALTMFAGAAGVGTLVLGLRTHFTGETDRLNNQFDAATQKLTDKSAVVQSAGLLALQRIGRRHAAYRPAAVEVLSSYLSAVDEAEMPGFPASLAGLTPSAKRLDLATRILNEFG